jgi:hypothetical protein
MDNNHTQEQSAQNSENSLIKLQTEKEITVLFKTFLTIVEDIRIEHAKMTEKLLLNVDEEFVNSIDYFNEDYYQRLRSKILDSGNSTSRNLLTFINYFDFIINQKKLDEALKNKVSHKKTHYNSTYIVEND